MRMLKKGRDDFGFSTSFGKLLFAVAGLIQKARFARRGVLRMTNEEQRNPGKPKRMSGVLWDLFSGSARYREVFMRPLHPAYIKDLVWNLVAGNFGRPRPSAVERRHGTH